MSLYLVKTPNFIKSLFKDLVWSFTTSEKKIYLTFDDGPTPEITNYILEQLKLHQAKATFFCVGENIEKHPSIFSKIIIEGHSVGNHTHNHLKGWKTNNTSYIENIEKAQITIQKNSSITSKLFRPPYGKIGYFQSKKLKKRGHKIIMWDVLSGDFDLKITAEKTLKNVLNNVQNGSIVVFHDHQKAYEKLQYCLPIILNHYSSLGYSFEQIK